eukprot:31434-Pelagococcus_subviridis.AAC.27
MNCAKHRTASINAKIMGGKCSHAATTTGAELARAICPSHLRWPAGLFFRKSMIPLRRSLRGAIYDVFLT